MSDPEKHKILLLPENQRISADDQQSLFEALTMAGIMIRSDCGGAGRCGKCSIRIIDVGKTSGCPPDELEQCLISEEDLGSGFRLACRMKIESAMTVEIPDSSRFIPEVVAKPTTQQLLDEALAFRGNDQSTLKGYGLAVDLGTTTIGVYLCDLSLLKVTASIAVRNPQALLGADVISRISAVMMDQRNLARLKQMAVGGIEAAIRSLCDTIHISPEEISRMTIVGNSTMIHLILGEDPSSIGTSPYQPKFTEERKVQAQEIGFHFNPAISVYTPPLISGFLGADILAAAYAVRFFDQPQGTLLVDMGTNGELMLKGSKGITATSCATGPAFEGANIHHGMQAAPGAVDAMKLDNHCGKIEISVIKNNKGLTVKPSGICGSGILSAVAEFIRSGVVLEDGAFNPQGTHPGLKLDKGKLKKFVIAYGEATATGRDLIVTQKDIRSIQLAKSALTSGIKMICEKAGIKRPEKILLAGAFGNYMDLDDCYTIGLLAGVGPKDIKVIGNAAGVGAVLTLFDHASIVELKELARLAKVFNLSANSEFQNIFIKNLNF
ncbi:MAG: DUF4445 domain-containing protein [Deltaproteobacteria bacterium]|nr:DUF4445 domain-containing protein [Deltaproteobacteria bacterium]